MPHLASHHLSKVRLRHAFVATIFGSHLLSLLGFGAKTVEIGQKVELKGRGRKSREMDLRVFRPKENNR